MSVPRKKIVTGIVLIALTGSAGSVWRVRAQTGAAPFQIPAQPLASRTPPAGVTSGDRGVTYHALESKATRVTTRFADAMAIADRGPDGQLVTIVTDLSGNEVATFRVHQIDRENDSMEFTLPDRTTRHAARRAGLRPTLDWSNQQAYSLWKDRNALDRSSLEWQDTLVRPTGARKRDAAGEALQTDTEWSGGFSATVTKKIGAHISYTTGRKTTGLVFVSGFRQDGVELGFSQWWPQERTFAWSFPGLTEGYVDAARLRQTGGWSFTPDMAWMNTQNLALYQFHTLLRTRGAVSERRGGWLERLGAFIAPTLFANEAGCDALHWLDQSLFRPCCDAHDRCYGKEDPACGQSSWWTWWSSWRCDLCNLAVVFCFMSGSNNHVLYRFP